MSNFLKKTNRKIRKPIDKKSNYVKRCVGIPGDSLEIRDGYVYINGVKNELPDRARLQFLYEVNTGGATLSRATIKNRYHAREWGKLADGNYILNLADEDVSKVKNNPTVKNVTRQITPKGQKERVFANLGNRDNFGPIFIPKKGATVELNQESLPYYKKIIEEYEKNDLQQNGDQIILNGQSVSEYTFKQDYYWMMGDNRHNSEDSRYWGYVPFDHVVGKPVFIWFSWNSDGKGLGKVRWERLFTTVGGSGEPVSYFYYFLGILALYYGYSVYKKRKAA